MEKLKKYGHVRKNHSIYGKIVKNKKIKVNSYHDYGIRIKDLSKKFNVLASLKTKLWNVLRTKVKIY